MFQRIFDNTQSSNIDQVSVLNSGEVLISYKSNTSKIYHFQTETPVEIVSQVQAMSFPGDSIGRKVHEWKTNGVLKEVIVKNVGTQSTVTF